MGERGIYVNALDCIITRVSGDNSLLQHSLPEVTHKLTAIVAETEAES